MKISPDILRRRILDKHPTLRKDAKIGVVASVCDEQSVKDQPTGADIIMVATTNGIDLDNEVVVPEGADTSYFFKNRSIFVDHNYGVGDCIGKLRSASPKMKNGEQTGWQVRFHVYPLTKNPYAQDIITFAKDNALACSIGFEAVDAGRPEPDEIKRFKRGEKSPRSIVRKWNWLELSVTMFPCNVEACQVGFGPAEQKEWAGEVAVKRLEYLREKLRKNQIAEVTAKAFGLTSLRPNPAKRLVVDLAR